ncbi:MAG: hypothetical protein JF593_11070, partial [Novosphingobium sp.]|nr:hypothetical protein [Novosphingobium sp.]
MLPLAASVALVIAGAGAAWLTRTPPSRTAPATPEGPAAAAVPAPKPAPGQVERRLVLAGPGEIVGALTAIGVAQSEAQAAADTAARVLTGQGEVHTVVDLLPNGPAATLLRLQAAYADGSGAVVQRNASGAFAGTKVAAVLSRQVKVLRGELDTESFYSSAVGAGVRDTLIPEFINAFGYEF